MVSSYFIARWVRRSDIVVGYLKVNDINRVCVAIDVGAIICGVCVFIEDDTIIRRIKTVFHSFTLTLTSFPFDKQK